MDSYPFPSLVLHYLYVANLLSQAEDNPVFTHVVDQSFDNLRVYKTQQPRTLIDQRYPDPQSREDTGKLAANNPTANRSEGTRKPVKIQDVVAGKDCRSIGGDIVRPGRGGSYSNHYLVSRYITLGLIIDVFKVD